MTWQPGQSGNPKGGSTRPKRWKDALERALKRNLDGNALETIADRCVLDAINGDKDARREVAERLDGKVAQAIIGGDEGDAPLAIQVIERTIVKGKDPDSGGVSTPPEASTV